MVNTFEYERFAAVYNDIEAFPNLTDVAVELGIAYQTVRNKAGLLRARHRRGEDVPELISRVVAAQKPKDARPPEEHANARADALRSAVHEMLTSSRYPVVNPDCVIIDHSINQFYNRFSGAHEKREGTPRTWFSDTLRVESVERPAGRRFLFTSAQNDAPIHEGFWENLKAYANHIDADIVIGPGTYETNWWAENTPASRTYHPDLAEYLCFGQMQMGHNFVFCGEMNTLPTASRPISDLKTYSRGRWAVFPHGKLQLASVPSTDPNVQAHQVMTTGSVTLPKVVGRKAGIKSIFHYVIGAAIVEFDENGDVFCRQINAEDDGSFYDLQYRVENGQVSTGDNVEAMVVGDIHLRKLSDVNSLAVFGFDPASGKTAAGSMVEQLRPREILLHDIFDNESRNHHHVHDNAYSYEMAIRNRENVFEEISDVADFLVMLRCTGADITVVDSNHDIALERYAREGRYRNDGINIRTGLELELAYLEWREKVADALDSDQPAPSFSLLEWAVRRLAGSDVDHVGWVHDGKSYMIGDVECGHHGFRGANGARGSVAGYAQLGRKMTIADKHSPEILDGVYVAGCMNLHHGYNKGPSGWAIACVLQYHNGKRTIVTMQHGKWRA